MFKSGSKWIRADFHLHTKADKEFTYTGDEDRFITDYVNKMKDESIGLGAITNHNKFDFKEYKALQKKASRKGITILPGVELSVKEGGNGIHCLIIFNPADWINGSKESINQFLDEVFKGIDNRENENTRCNKDLISTIEILNSYKKDFFILMAHIEQKSGFFKECNGGLIETLSKNQFFKDKVLGFQKGRTRDNMNQLEQWMKYKIPYIEGSDCKSINGIGKGKKSFIKIGEGSFDSVLLAFKDHENRISLLNQEFHHGYIKSIEFIGGKLDQQKIYLSPELNTLIGIRGSGKSSIIEAIRFALNIPISDTDERYKRDVVNNILGSGGQVILNLQDNYNKKYKIKRIWGETPHILDEFDNEIGVKIDTILQGPLYFGQKDLSAMNNGFELNLLNKLVGKKTQDSKSNLSEIEEDFTSKVKKLIGIEKKVDSVVELKGNLSDIKHKIKIFEENGLSDKLSKQVNFQKDKETIISAYELMNTIIKKVNTLLAIDAFSELNKITELKSEEVPDLFEKLSKEIVQVINNKDKIEKILKEFNDSFKKINGYSKEIQEIINSLEEEFAEIKRMIDIPNIDPDEFAKLKIREEKITKSIEINIKKEVEKKEVELDIQGISGHRNEALRKEFDVYKHEIEKINSNQEALEISIEFKGNKEHFKEQLRLEFKGANLSQNNYAKIIEEFSDFSSILIDNLLDSSAKMKEILTESQLSKVKSKIRKNYAELIKIRTPNKIEIKYHGKPIIKHSIGQRASALVLFILSQKENNLIVIDQPEDDLDNQVIYNEIIKEIKSRKKDVQFIFATHNANIPVLGDSDQVIAVSYDDKQVEVSTGSIDNKVIQSKVVNIMEGGREAFTKRTEIYNLWSN
ncbi:TrlF family AAA-like ATPase [Carnobacterium maltaromaticum]|uniref:TrlF family AAA-like ATPase n=3 Tax=Carnobacterium maltaromaticum TaxID=2751 RepID=UPI0009C4293A|nr:hypothetical protein [Carnobacterium maltaromaticum]CRH18282.1 conserved hypothetical protein [Carnobacterium maltaromaticum]CRH21605.1 conserved hypothetical protein [Carnobacterium maltaromaticum]